MNGSRQVSIFLPSSTIFPGIKPSLSSLSLSLKHLSVRHTILWCARLLRTVTLPIYEGLQEPQRECVKLIFNETQLRALQNFTRSNPDSFITVFFRSQLLETIRWVLVSADCGKKQPGSNPDNERTDFLKSLLICSDLWGSRAFKGMTTSLGDVREDRRQSVVFFRRSRESATSLSIVHNYSTVVRSWDIYQDLFPKEFPRFGSEFAKRVGITYRDFCYCQLLIWSNLINREKEWAHIDISTIQGHPFQSSFEAYLKHQSNTVSELRECLWPEGSSPSSNIPMKLRPFYDHPVLVTEDRKLAVVLDPIAFVESMTAGPLFIVLSGTKNQGEIFNAFGKAFDVGIVKL